MNTHENKAQKGLHGQNATLSSKNAGVHRPAKFDESQASNHESILGQFSKESVAKPFDSKDV